MDRERLSVYINSLDDQYSPLLRRIAKEAAGEGVPIVRKETASLLKTLTVMKRPSRILEVGTAVGYSALLLAENAPRECRITTIEKDGRRAMQARENFERAGRGKQITLLEGDAAQILPGLSAPFDFIFMDAAKGQYIHFLEDVLRLLKPGGLLISDNVLQDGSILESRFMVERRDRTIHSRMREYLYTITHHALLTTAVLATGDGVAVSVRAWNEGCEAAAENVCTDGTADRLRELKGGGEG